jgi:surfactin synthase thioesterase subunit
MAELVNFVVDYSRSIDRNSPFVIFGHSFGALLAFEVAQRLKKLGFSIAGLIFAGAKAPHDHDRRSSNWHLLPDAELIINLKELGGIPAQIFDETALIQMLLPVFRADFLLLAQYSHKAEFKARFDAKVTVLGGSNDSLVSAESLMRWNEIIDDRVSIKMLDGGHFFILEQATRILWMIKNWIRDAQEGKARV